MLELFTLQGSSPKIQQCLKRGGALQERTDVPFDTGRYLHVHGVVTNRSTTPGEIGAGAHGSKQGILLQRMAKLRWSCTGSPQTNCDSVLADSLSNRNVSEGRGHVDCCLPHVAVVATNFPVSPVSPVSTSAKPSLAAFATRSAASWRHHDGALASMLSPRQDPLRRMSAAHTDPSLETAVADTAELWK